MQYYLYHEGSMHGRDSTVWGSVHQPKKHSPDLFSLPAYPKNSSTLEAVTEWVVSLLSRYLIRVLRRPSRIVTVKDDTVVLIGRLIRSIEIILACLVPMISIIILSTIHSPRIRLAMVAIFTALIVSCLTLVTSAKRSEIFAVAAA
jgi:hypothetical protein